MISCQIQLRSLSLLREIFQRMLTPQQLNIWQTKCRNPTFTSSESEHAQKHQEIQYSNSPATSYVTGIFIPVKKKKKLSYKTIVFEF